MPKPPQSAASEVLRHNLLILIGLPSLILWNRLKPISSMYRPTGGYSSRRKSNRFETSGHSEFETPIENQLAVHLGFKCTFSL